MGGTAPKSLGWEPDLVGRLLRVGTLAALLSAGVNGIVLAVASSLLGAVVNPHDETVALGQVVGASVVGSFGVAVIFAVIDRFTRRPVRIYWGAAAVGLLLSFVLIALAGATGSSAGTLALMHMVVAATIVGLLTKLGRKEQGVLGRTGIRRAGW